MLSADLVNSCEGIGNLTVQLSLVKCLQLSSICVSGSVVGGLLGL